MAITLPYTIAPDDDIDAEPLSANFQAIADKFSGGIVDADVSTLAGISGSKIAANSLPGDRIATGTITKTQMGLLCIDTPQLLALAVTKDKLTTTVGQKITKSQMELYALTNTFTFVPGGTKTCVAFSVLVGTASVGGTSSWTIILQPIYVDTVSGAISAGASQTYTPTVAVPSGTTTVIGFVLRAYTAPGTVTVDLNYVNNS